MISFRSIAFQTIGVVTAVGIIIGLILAVATPQRAADLGKQVLTNDTRFISGVLAENLALGVESMVLDDGLLLNQSLNTLRDQNNQGVKSLADVRVYDADGKLLASLERTSGWGQRANLVNSMVFEELDKIIRVTAPLVNQQRRTVGVVQVDFSKAFLAEQASDYTWFAIWAALGAMLIASFAGWFLSRSIARPLAALSNAAEAIASGDIEQEIKVNSHNEIGRLAAAFYRLVDYLKEMSNAAREIAHNNLSVTVIPRSEKDELGKSFNTMVHNLTNMIYEVTENADNLARSAASLGILSKNILQGADNQQQQVTQVSAAIQEMAATVEESSRHAGDAASASEQAAGTADTGGRVVADTQSAMHRIADVVAKAASSIGELSKSAEQISGIIGVIDEVADQTNMLALNAAIEAARAGEQGRGFAVVADEVRKLAERTGKATAEIAAMIKSIQLKTGEVVGSMQQSITEVHSGQDMAEKASQSLTQIVTMAQHVTDMITQIATAADEQSAAAGQMSHNAEEILAVAQATTDGAKQTAESAVSLSEQARDLRQLVATFRLPERRA